MAKAKIINDPIHGFITIPHGLLLNCVEHPWFQRLRRIRQLGVADFVYPGALHTRFHHALGAMHLMGLAIQTLRGKGVKISDNECEAAQAAILLHDIGHGPFSHALEHSFIAGCSHERIGAMLIARMNTEFGGRLAMALEMFEGRYSRRFFHQLISSQLDVDRLDYLKRDSFFTGVIEGGVGSSRILKMLDVVDDELVIEEKGIYSVEAFLNARRIMYWQVYLHKTTVSAEAMLALLMQRARELSIENAGLRLPLSLEPFFSQTINPEKLESTPELLDAYAMLDDFDIWACVKEWLGFPDFVLNLLCKGLLDRKLFKIELGSEPISPERVKACREIIQAGCRLTSEETELLVSTGEVSNAAYVARGGHINILTRNGQIIDIAKASDLSQIDAMQKPVKKFYLCRWNPLPLQP
ncbi:MAG: HD domain-containing protein [Bacteroidota bacterium]